MIAIVSGIIGFVSGAALATWLLKRKSKKHWDGGYRMVRKDKFPARNRQVQTYQPPAQTSSYNTYKEPENKDPPSIPDWF